MKKQSKKIAFLSIGGLFVCLLLFWAFKPSETPVDFLNRVDQSDDRYKQTKTFGDLKVDLLYKSPAYQATAQKLRSNDLKKYSYEELCDDYQESATFNLRLENEKGGPLMKGMAADMNSYQELVRYLSFDIQKDLQLFTSQDTINCAFVHFERNYDIAPFTNVELVFNLNNLSKPLLKEDEWSVQFDAERFGLGPLNFRYQSAEVNEKPNFTF